MSKMLTPEFLIDVVATGGPCKGFYDEPLDIVTAYLLDESRASEIFYILDMPCPEAVQRVIIEAVQTSEVDDLTEIPHEVWESALNNHSYRSNLKLATRISKVLLYGAEWYKGVQQGFFYFCTEKERSFAGEIKNYLLKSVYGGMFCDERHHYGYETNVWVTAPYEGITLHSRADVVFNTSVTYIIIPVWETTEEFIAEALKDRRYAMRAAALVHTTGKEVRFLFIPKNLKNFTPMEVDAYQVAAVESQEEYYGHGVKPLQGLPALARRAANAYNAGLTHFYDAQKTITGPMLRAIYEKTV